MKLLIAELFPEKGHFRLFTNIVRLLAQSNEVTVVFPKSVHETIVGCKTILAPYDYYYSKTKNKLHLVLQYVSYSKNVCKYIASIDKMERFDAVISVTYNEVGFAFGKKYFRDLSKVLLMSHNNLDLVLNNKIKEILFNTYAHKVKHLVQCKFIKEEFSKSFNIPQKEIGVWMHPQNRNEEGLHRSTDIFDCVGISNSNDDVIIKEIIEREHDTGYIKKHGLRVVLRSKLYEFDDGYLKVFKGFLEKDQYDYYINNAKCIFLPFPTGFKLRMSGTLVDAFSNCKPIIGTPIALFKACSEQYPAIMRIYSPDLFVEQIKDCNKSLSGDLYQRFIEVHSDNSVLNNMTDELNNLLYGDNKIVSIDF